MGKGSSLKEVPVSPKKKNKFVPLDKAQTVTFLSNFFYVGPLALDFCDTEDNDFANYSTSKIIDEETVELPELFPSEWFPVEDSSSSPSTATAVLIAEEPVVAQNTNEKKAEKIVESYEEDIYTEDTWEELLRTAEMEYAEASSTYEFNMEEDHFLNLAQNWDDDGAKLIYKQKKGGVLIRSKKDNKHEKKARCFMTKGPRMVSLSHPSNIISSVPRLEQKASPSQPVAATNNANFDADLKKAMALSLNTSTPSNHRTANPPPPAQVHNAMSSSYLSAVGLSAQQVQELFTRELTPEDYELLLLLDNSVKPKTIEKSTLSSFSSLTLQAGDHRNGSICAICMDELVVGDQIKVLPCQHFFHGSCIDTWLSNNSTICPVDGLPVS